MAFADDANRQRATVCGWVESRSGWISTISLSTAGPLDAAVDER